ncbi:hypothetical protein [Actinomadura atramentaria]|uniref:hypothetical protein n=1 Tax=Actinomadura atramentaria TaxID=1990 RepID=UPI0012FA6D4E|nr:hypothetical protein [Actinomadura atramentaria]
MQERTDGRRISPAVPSIANLLLAALWACSTYGGWGESGFCGDGPARDPACSDGFAVAVLLSTPFAAAAAVLALASWASHDLRRRPSRNAARLTVAALGWVVAEGVLFLGGFVVQP